MSWNRPNTVPPPLSAAGAGKKKSIICGILAVAIVAIAAVAVWFFLAPSETSDLAETSKPDTLINEVSPAKVPVKTEKPLYETNFWELDASQTNGFTEGMLRKWKIAHRPRPKELPKATYKKAKYEIFSHRSENAIAGLLMHKPGQGMIGTPVYGEKFEQDFLKSCEEPIIVDENDDDYSRSLKELMKETKIELRQRMANGENLSQILLDTHKELQKLGQIRQSIEEDMRKAIRETAETEADVDDCFEAANMMLESKGLAPMRSNPILKKSLMHILTTKEAK